MNSLRALRCSWVTSLTFVAVWLCAALVSCGGDDAASDSTGMGGNAAMDAAVDVGNSGHGGADAASCDGKVCPDGQAGQGGSSTAGSAGHAAAAGAGSAGAAGFAGNAGSAPEPIKGCIDGNFQAIAGDLHAHTANSDGQGTAKQAFVYARDTSKMDFLILTDHGPKMSDAEWAGCHAQADAIDKPGTFVADCGWELAFAGGGHANVVFNGNQRFTPTTLKSFHDKVTACSDCIVQYNHPASPDYPWVDFTLDAASVPHIALHEFNGGGTWDDKIALFATVLGKGWRVSPTYNGDNHTATWGSNGHRTGLWVTTLSRSAIHTAMRERRSFATGDSGATLRMTASGCWMGSQLSAVTKTKIEVTASDNDGFKQIELVGKGNKVLKTVACNGAKTCTGTYEMTVTGASWVFAHATEVDGNPVVGAPIWFK